MVFTRVRSAVLLVGVLALATACSSSGGKPAAGTSPAGSSHSTTSSTTAPGTGAGPEYYVSIGDSYAAGYQPTGHHQGSTTRNGFAYQLTSDAVAKGYHFQLQNFGCAGATTGSLLTQAGCPADALGPGATDYAPQTQAAAAEAFLLQHQGHVGLVTVSISGNDITPCGAAANPTTCVTTALATVKTNMTTLLAKLRAAAGPSTPIVGITYPDVLLADYLEPSASAKGLAQLSVAAFQSLINPALQALYTGVNGTFVDVTAATGAYGPLTATTSLPGVGTVPVPVAKVCELTYMCQYQDIHPRTNGYALIAQLILDTLPSH